MSCLIKCDLCGKVVEYGDSFEVEVATQNLLGEDGISGEYKGGCDACVECAEKIAGKSLRCKDDVKKSKVLDENVALVFYLANRKEKSPNE